ncbi:hypothetical protein ACFV9G_22885 [Nocardioides sp. NPDC059952]|uniref:hypothetical protein n=1 Tax=Nocardioides sp. NPDC059952 TaxID=3347014 RepID=UPI003668D025
MTLTVLRRPLALTLSLAAIAAGSAACGGSASSGEEKSYADESPKKILADAKASMSSLKSVHISGAGLDNGDEMKIDMTVSTAGDCTGTIGTPDGEMTLLVVGGKAWFKADRAFWEANAGGDADAILEMVGKKWVVGGDDLGDLTELCDWDELSDEFLELLVPSTIEGLTIKKSKDQVDGQPVIKLEDRSSEQGTIYVQAEEPHYVVKVANTGKEAADVTFSAFDDPTEIVAPKPRQQIDFENMQ